jgi:hypothetical protein
MAELIEKAFQTRFLAQQAGIDKRIEGSLTELVLSFNLALLQYQAVAFLGKQAVLA